MVLPFRAWLQPFPAASAQPRPARLCALPKHMRRGTSGQCNRASRFFKHNVACHPLNRTLPLSARLALRHDATVKTGRCVTPAASRAAAATRPPGLPVAPPAGYQRAPGNSPSGQPGTIERCGSDRAGSDPLPGVQRWCLGAGASSDVPRW